MMKNHKLFFLLDELKSNFSMNLLRQTLNCLNEETNIFELYKQLPESTKVLSGQDERFYRELAFQFISDLNEGPLLYFTEWELRINLFDDLSRNKFLQMSKELAGTTDAADYLNGMSLLSDGQPEIALFHFNRIPDITVSYFLAICYLGIDNIENCIKQNNQFLKFLGELQHDEELHILPRHFGLVLAKWNVYNYLGYCFNRLGEYENAVIAYEQSLTLFTLEDSFYIKKDDLLENNLDGFQLFINNYLLALEKSGNLRKCVEVLDFTIQRYPNIAYYHKQKIKLLNKLQNKSVSEDVIKSVFKPKKPFGLDSFQEVKLLSKEKALEDMIIEQIKYGYKVFGKELEVYQNEKMYGRQYRLYDINGILDLLLIEKSTRQLYVVELKRDSVGLEVIAQIGGYMDSLSKEFGQPVKGIICAHRASKDLVEEAGRHDSIELYSYHFDFIKLN